MANNQLRVLRRKLDFETLKADGERVTPNRWLLLSYLPNQMNHSRFGWTIGRKVGNAVTRNRLKRWCREYFRTAQLSLETHLDLNVVIRPGNQDFYKELSRDEFFHQLERGWKSIEKHLK